MITAAQLRAARVLLGIDQRRLAELSGLSVPTIQRMEASETMVRGNVDSLVKLITALEDNAAPRAGQPAAAGTDGFAKLRETVFKEAEALAIRQCLLGARKSALQDELADRALRRSRRGLVLEGSASPARAGIADHAGEAEAQRRVAEHLCHEAVAVR